MFEEQKVLDNARILARKEEKRIKREQMAIARAKGEDVESLHSSNVHSEISGSKKS